MEGELLVDSRSVGVSCLEHLPLCIVVVITKSVIRVIVQGVLDSAACRIINKQEIVNA